MIILHFLLTYLNERKTCYITDGKGHQTVSDFVDVLEDKNGDRKQIEHVSCDMPPAFIKGVNEYLPEAEMTFDKFHLLKIINEAVDAVRRFEQKITHYLKVIVISS